LRYYHFGNEMKENFEQRPDLMRELRKLFKSQNDKCSYFDLFQFISFKIDIKLENWEEDALEHRLDRLEWPSSNLMSSMSSRWNTESTGVSHLSKEISKTS